MQIDFVWIKKPTEHYKSGNSMACYSCITLWTTIPVLPRNLNFLTRNRAFDNVLESYVSDSSLGEKTEETSIPMIPIPIGRLCNSMSIIIV